MVPSSASKMNTRTIGSPEMTSHANICGFTRLVETFRGKDITPFHCPRLPPMALNASPTALTEDHSRITLTPLTDQSLAFSNTMPSWR